MFASDVAAITGDLRSSLSDASADTDKRLAAARSLINIDDGKATTDAILLQINVQSAPDLQTGLLRALTASHDDATGTKTSVAGAVAVVSNE